MNCSKAQKLINDHIDNLLTVGQTRNLESHLERCVTCRDFLTDVRSIVHSAKELNNRNPSEDLWPVIKRQVLKNERALRTHKRGLWENIHLPSRGPVFALSTLLVIVFLIPALYYGLPHMQTAKNNPGGSTLINFSIAEQQYQSAVETLGHVIEIREARLNPELMAVFKKNLMIIDESILICKQSIDKYPKNQETNELLMICYRKKIELLNEIKDMTLQS